MRQLLLLVASLTAWVPAAADSIAGDQGSIEITPLIHSSVQLQYQGTVVQIDPWNRLGLDNAQPADLILITDNVGHHLDVGAVRKLRKPGAPVVIAANGSRQIPDGLVMANGEREVIAGIPVAAVAAYDIIPGEPSHPRGEANGYVLELGGRRFYFAGVTECVDEVKALENIDVAFLPMNIPLGRMTPAATAECAKILDPEVVYPYHYDQDYARRALNPDYVAPGLPGGVTVDQTLQWLAAELDGSGIELRIGNFYPPLD
ncbi:MAG: MBL fold metallo-hydrolase [Gammaproteobacteria bacterium]|nr:MBL fold metallo-hydrolase [Pseudomonadales bacterium]MCP5346623.1 MBL fold metallo-hydrolase [Pseudomonadales bacterium]